MYVVCDICMLWYCCDLCLVSIIEIMWCIYKFFVLCLQASQVLTWFIQRVQHLPLLEQSQYGCLHNRGFHRDQLQVCLTVRVSTHAWKSLKITPFLRPWKSLISAIIGWYPWKVLEVIISQLCSGVGITVLNPKCPNFVLGYKLLLDVLTC